MVGLHDARIWPYVAEELREITNPGTATDAVKVRNRARPQADSDDRDSASAARYKQSSSQPYLPVLHLALINLTGFALLAAAYHLGWIEKVIAADGSGICVAIFIAFLGGLAACGYKVWAISDELNCIARGELHRRSWAAAYIAEVAGRSAGSRAISASALRMKITNRIVIIRYIANSLVLLGLIGTVLGFIIALSAVDPSSAGDVHAIEPMVTQLIRGMSVALYTTLVGAVLNLWLTVNHRLLASGSVRLATELIALGEANARSGLD